MIEVPSDVPQEMVLFTKNVIESLGYNIYDNIPEAFDPEDVSIYVSDIDLAYENNFSVNMYVLVNIEFVEDDPLMIPLRLSNIITTIERRLRNERVRCKSTFKFRKPDIIKLKLSTKVILKYMYTEVLGL
jgi:hypothetical protein